MEIAALTSQSTILSGTNYMCPFSSTMAFRTMDTYCQSSGACKSSQITAVIEFVHSFLLTYRWTCFTTYSTYVALRRGFPMQFIDSKHIKVSLGYHMRVYG